MVRRQTLKKIGGSVATVLPKSAFMAGYVFLGLNGYDVEVEEMDVAATIERAAAGRIRDARVGGVVTRASQEGAIAVTRCP
jgi:hypothetical protein